MGRRLTKVRIVFLFEGTCNFFKNESVISKLSSILDVSDQQLVHCESGSGTFGGLVKKIMGAAFGCDSFEILLRHYRWLATVIKECKLKPEQVEIFAFGFSRGAYQARLFAELLSRFGLPISVDSAAEKIAKFEHGIRGLRKDQFPPPNASYQRMIKFIGLFDAVGAWGYKNIYARLAPLPSCVTVKHALAIHEKRLFFFPAMEVEQPGQTMWFAGVHSDVGWGYNKEGERSSTLGLISVSWMLKNLPLTFKSSLRKIPFCFMDMFLLFSCYNYLRHESFQGLWRLLFYRKRKQLVGRKHSTVIAVEEVMSRLNIHPAVLWRNKLMSLSLRRYLNRRSILKSQKRLLWKVVDVNKIFLKHKVYQSPCQMPTCLLNQANGPCTFPH